MGLGDRRRALMHRSAQVAPNRAVVKRAKKKAEVPSDDEELDNLQFALPPALAAPHHLLIQNDEIHVEDVPARDPDEILSVSEAEIRALLKECVDAYDKERLDDLLKECKNKVVEGVVIPFGLGGVVAHYDKNGGNVNTVHNVREGVYATEDERRRYRKRGEYDGAAYHSHSKYKEVNARAKQGPVDDAYVGGKVRGIQNLDHVVAAKEVHDDPGRVLAGLNGADLANTESNLKFTNEHVNKSKKALSMDDYVAFRKNRVSQIQGQIDALEHKASAGKLNANQEKSLDELKRAKAKFENDGFDEKLAKSVDKKARAEMEKTIGKAYYGSAKFAKSVAATGAAEGLKMGWQQALGLALTEFFVGIIDEARDAYKNGFKIEDSGFWESLRKRFMRVVKRVVARWRAALDAFKQGVISGFLSNLVTVLINCVVRTGKNLVRMIREGFFSLVRAIKILLTRPNGMTMREAAHEATKIIASGLVVVGGIALAEWLDKMIALCPPLELVSDILVTIVSGVVTGIATALVVYAIDKLDLFDVNARKKHASIMSRLADMIDASLAEAESMLANMDNNLLTIDSSLAAATRHAASAAELNARIRDFGRGSVFL